MRRHITIAAAAAALLATPVMAQRAGSVEAGLLGRATLFDPSLMVTTAVGIGARASVFLHPRWLVDVEVSTAGADGLAGRTNVSYQPLRLRVNALRPASESGQIVAGLGLVATRFGGDFGESDAGLTALLGFRVALPRSLVARVDGTLDYVPAPANGAANNWNAGLQVGISYRFK